LPVKVEVQVLPHGRGLPLPTYQTAQASGMDLHAANQEPVVIAPGQVVLIPTGLKLALPAGYEAQVRPRSGLALRQAITVLNSPGTIDADYRGEVCVILLNAGAEPFTVRRGDRVAQMVIAPVVQAELHQVEELPDTSRAGGGFGHTGV